MLVAHDILMLYGPTWDGPSRTNKHHLARYWGKRNRVLYVEVPPNPLSFFTRRDEALRLVYRWFTSLRQLAQGVWVKSYFWPVPYRGETWLTSRRLVNELNQVFVAPHLRRSLRGLGFDKPIIFAISAYGLRLVKEIPRSLLVYQCNDDVTVAKGCPESFRLIELEFGRACDLVVTVTDELRRAKSRLNSNIFTVPNGAEVDHFARTQAPDTLMAQELRDLPRPIVGYIGSVFQWLDQSMIAHAAQVHPDWSFVFVGLISTNVDQLRVLPNVHLLGPRPYADLPSHLKGFDVATVPFIFHDVTMRASPIKFYEYLASGVPIVATRLPDFEPFAHLAGLVTTPEEFVAALEDAIAHDTPEKRQARMAEAQNHSWEARFAQIDHLIEEGLAAKEWQSAVSGGWVI